MIRLAKIYVKTLLIFAVLGPPFGLWSISIYFLLTDQRSDLLQGVEKALFLMFAGIPFSYLFGITPALVSGLVIASLQVAFDRLNVLASALVGLLIGGSLATLVLETGIRTGDPNVNATLVYLVPCLGATIACCWVSQCKWSFDYAGAGTSSKVGINQPERNPPSVGV
jgi:hypothetical protein